MTLKLLHRYRPLFPYCLVASKEHGRFISSYVSLSLFGASAALFSFSSQTRPPPRAIATCKFAARNVDSFRIFQRPILSPLKTPRNFGAYVRVIKTLDSRSVTLPNWSSSGCPLLRFYACDSSVMGSFWQTANELG